MKYSVRHAPKLPLFLVSLLVCGMATSAANAATVKYTAVIDGKQTVPPAETALSGDAELEFDDQTRELRGQINLNIPGDTKITDQLIHRAACGATGPLARKLTAPGMNGVIAIDPSQPVKLDEALATALAAGELYINLRTERSPTGEARGQILPTGGGKTCPASGSSPSPSGTPDGGVSTDNNGAPTEQGGNDDGGCRTTPGSTPASGSLLLVSVVASAIALSRRTRRRA